MDMTPQSKKPMSHDEVAYLVELIQSQKIIISKETNAATNKDKEDAWVGITAAFNARCGGFPKKKEQLKTKWDNLKKAARKRSQVIRMNNLKTGGGKPDFIPPDEILDKVASTLGSTCMGFEVPFGGDGRAGDCTVLDLEVVVEEEVQDDTVANVQLPSTTPVIDVTPTRSEAIKRKLSYSDIEEGSSSGTKFLYGMPTMAKSLQSRGKKKKVEDGRLERNLAIAEYYKKKSLKLDLEIKLLKCKCDKENISNN